MSWQCYCSDRRDHPFLKCLQIELSIKFLLLLRLTAVCSFLNLLVLQLLTHGTTGLAM